MKGPTPEAREKVEQAEGNPERIADILLEVLYADYSDDYGPILDGSDAQRSIRKIVSTSSSASEAYDRFVKLMKEIDDDR